MSSERRSAAERASVLRTIAEVGRAAAERVLEKARTLLAIKGYTVNTSLRTGHAAGQLLEAIREFRPDLIVIGANGRTAAKRFVLGSVAQKVIKCALVWCWSPEPRGWAEQSRSRGARDVRGAWLGGSGGYHARQMEGGSAMTVVMVIWLIVLSVLLYVVYGRAEEGRALQWRLEELRRELESTKRDLDETRKKLERATFPV